MKTATIYEKASETAKKIRKALKSKFPGQKFSVTSKNYSMGSSVDVDWIDGPLLSAVQEVTRRFQSASFDGMIDLETCHGYEFEGKEYSGAKYILAQRTYSDEMKEKLISAYKNKMSENCWENEAEWEILNRALRMQKRGDLSI